MRRDISPDDDWQPCPHCPKPNRKYKRLQRHLQKFHGVKGRKARVCTSEKGLQNQRKFCPLCDLDAARLRDHLKGFHNISAAQRLDALISQARLVDPQQPPAGPPPPQQPLQAPPAAANQPVQPQQPPAGPPPPQQPLQAPPTAANQPVQPQQPPAGPPPQLPPLQAPPAAANQPVHPQQPPPDVQAQQTPNPDVPAPRPPGPLHNFTHYTILVQFFKWLVGPEKNVKTNQAEQGCKHILRIWRSAAQGDESDLETERPLLTDILDEDKVRDNWLRTQTGQPGSIAAYLASLQAFLDMIRQGKRRLPYSGALESMKAAIVRWRVGVNKAKGRRRAQLLGSRIDIRPEEFRSVWDSNFATQTKETIANYQDGAYVSDATWHPARAYLLLRLACANASRNGAITNMTLREFLASKDVTSAGNVPGFVIAVADHKTSYTGQPVYLAVNPRLMNLLMWFLSMRETRINDPVAASRPDLPLFVSCERGHAPTQPSSSDVNHALQRFWKQAGGTSHLTLTIIRKSTTKSQIGQGPAGDAYAA